MFQLFFNKSYCMWNRFRKYIFIHQKLCCNNTRRYCYSSSSGCFCSRRNPL